LYLVAHERRLPLLRIGTHYSASTRSAPTACFFRRGGYDPSAEWNKAPVIPSNSGASNRRYERSRRK
jgi:hypothetical protein